MQLRTMGPQEKEVMGSMWKGMFHLPLPILLRLLLQRASRTSWPHLHRPGPAKEPEQGGEQETRSVQADRLSGEEKGAQEIMVQLSQEGPGE